MTEQRTLHVIQGEQAISDSQDVMITTVLGSCVAACMYDPQRQIGGMNHFLLADDTGAREGDMRFASASMERLVNGLLKQGAQRSRLQAKIFGGARMMAGLPDIGRRNGEAAIAFLAGERIPCISMSLGGNSARRIRFWPATGRAQQLLLADQATDPQSSSNGQQWIAL
ncbi:chemotaxis protein CheD [Gemmobacter denitrificans]|uniref:Probable chemoreceptor glutamine deamidase CheD n=1 Tax=Gemmobacter denitrificans TaxID=3123040 RepID=A0ABU8C0W3_9RHOB